MSEKTVAGQSIRNWNGKPYHSLDYMLKQTFGEKVYKVTLNGGMSCPNRDGKLGSRGSAGGSGDFAADAALPITDQIDSQIEMLRAKRPIHKYIAYFQAYTNTYAPVVYLRKIFTEAILHPSVVALSIGTRPDCIGDEILALLIRSSRCGSNWDFRRYMSGLPLISEGDTRFPVLRRQYIGSGHMEYRLSFIRYWDFRENLMQISSRRWTI